MYSCAPVPLEGEVNEALIIGGGVAGGSLAILLARAGRDVVVVDKSLRAHDKVCGEFMSAEAIRHIEALGISLKRLGAIRIHSSASRTRSAPIFRPSSVVRADSGHRAKCFPKETD
jgi:2-polyprenyl-6-methoxyphenol hydroxylase-like FAD-dependent oxidoreductase